MSRRTIRIIDLMCDAWNWQNCIDQAKDADELRRWSGKRDQAVGKLRLLLDQLDERERQHLIKYSNPDLDEQMRAISIELPWWKNRNDAPDFAI